MLNLTRSARHVLARHLLRLVLLHHRLQLAVSVRFLSVQLQVPWPLCTSLLFVVWETTANACIPLKVLASHAVRPSVLSNRLRVGEGHSPPVGDAHPGPDHRPGVQDSV
eukprot:6185993-Pleurochrysis_carterae.AAC.5